MELGTSEVHQEDQGSRLQGQDCFRSTAAVILAEDWAGLTKVYSNRSEVAQGECSRSSGHLQEERGQVEDTEAEDDDGDLGG